MMRMGSYLSMMTQILLLVQCNLIDCSADRNHHVYCCNCNEKETVADGYVTAGNYVDQLQKLPTIKKETVENPILYAGEYYDKETGLIYLRARYYNPKTKQFIQEDPARDRLNWYSYCENNPVNRLDPLSQIIMIIAR